MIGHRSIGETLSTHPEPKNETDKYVAAVT